MKSFPTWKTVTLGKFKSCENYLKAAEEKGHKIGKYAGQILRKIEWARRESGVDLVLATGADLGMTNDYTLGQLTKSVATLGLSACPAEVGPALRDQYDDQPSSDWILVLMDPVLDSGSDLKVFSIGRRSDGAYLNAYCADPGDRFPLGARWVACRPAASSQLSGAQTFQSLGPQPFVPPVPGSDRWNDAAEAYFRSKCMPSSDGIIFLDKWKHNV